MRKTTRAFGSAGFTIIEVMIALAITGIVMAVLIEVFTAQQQMYYRQTSLANAQANARSSLAIISRDVLMAGYTGIPLGLAHVNSASVGSGPNSWYGVMSLTNNGTPITSSGSTIADSSVAVATILKDVSKTLVPGGGTQVPDSFEIMGNFARGTTGLNTTIAEGATVTMIKIPGSGLSLFPNTGFGRPAFVMIGNNDRAEIFTFVSSPASGSSTGEVTIQINGVANNEYRANNVLGGENNMVIPILRRAYFVDTQNTTNLEGVTIGTLFIGTYKADGTAAGDGSTVELARDVLDFQVDYDVRDPGGFITTVNVSDDPCLVNSVRLRMTTKGWEPANATEELKKQQQINRELVSVVKIRNANLGQNSCKVLP